MNSVKIILIVIKKKLHHNLKDNFQAKVLRIKGRLFNKWEDRMPVKLRVLKSQVIAIITRTSKTISILLTQTMGKIYQNELT